MEAMHAHASDRKMTESGSAKFFVREDGSSFVQERGMLNDHEIAVIQRFISRHYMEMYERWSEDSEKGFYNSWWPLGCNDFNVGKAHLLSEGTFLSLSVAWDRKTSPLLVRYSTLSFGCWLFTNLWLIFINCRCITTQRFFNGTSLMPLPDITQADFTGSLIVSEPLRLHVSGPDPFTASCLRDRDVTPLYRIYVRMSAIMQ